VGPTVPKNVQFGIILIGSPQVYRPINSRVNRPSSRDAGTYAVGRIAYQPVVFLTAYIYLPHLS